MGYIAASTTAYLYFTEDFRRFFEYDNLQPGMQPGGIHGTKKSGGASSDYDQPAGWMLRHTNEKFRDQ